MQAVELITKQLFSVVTLTPSTEVRILVPQPNESVSYMLEAEASFFICAIPV